MENHGAAGHRVACKVCQAVTEVDTSAATYLESLLSPSTSRRRGPYGSATWMSGTSAVYCWKMLDLYKSDQFGSCALNIQQLKSCRRFLSIILVVSPVSPSCLTLLTIHSGDVHAAALGRISKPLHRGCLGVACAFGAGLTAAIGHRKAALRAM